jgi:hypothetical protein
MCSEVKNKKEKIHQVYADYTSNIKEASKDTDF